MGKYIVNSRYFVDFGEEWSYEFKQQAGVKSGSGGALKYGEIILLFLVNFLLILIIASILIATLLPAVAVVAGIAWLKAKLGL